MIKNTRELEHVGTHKGLMYVVTITDKDYLAQFRERHRGEPRFLLDSFNYRCGYVRVPEVLVDDRAYGFDESDYEVHGGVTYSGESINGCANNIDIETDKEFVWLGFDCNHADDNIEKCTLEYCIGQCKKLIEQVIDKSEFKDLYIPHSDYSEECIEYKELNNSFFEIILKAIEEEKAEMKSNQIDKDITVIIKLKEGKE